MLVQRTRAEVLGIATAITVAALCLPWSYPVDALWDRLAPSPETQLEYDATTATLRSVVGPERPHNLPKWINRTRFADLTLLLLGLVLTLPCPKESGLRIGNVRAHWRKLLVVVGGPLLLTVVVYPRLSVRPFANADLSVWLISPLAQDLVFGGAVYRLLRPHFSTYIHPRVPMEWVLPVGGLFFAAWHTQNFASMPASYVCFQLLYTWAAFAFVGLTRQWTGSLYYVTFAHMAGNCFVWCVK
jgi:membrane protease YdiL (CAAX protease family)